MVLIKYFSLLKLKSCFKKIKGIIINFSQENTDRVKKTKFHLWLLFYFLYSWHICSKLGNLWNFSRQKFYNDHYAQLAGMWVLCALLLSGFVLLWTLKDVGDMFCPQQPCSALVDSCLWLPLWTQSISYLVFPFFCCLLLLPALLLFLKNPSFSICAEVAEFHFCHVFLQRNFRLTLPWDPPICLSGIYISNESSFILSAFSTVQLLYSYILTENIGCGWSYLWSLILHS